MPHAHTDYPTLAFLVLLVGIFSLGWTTYATGDSYQVNATVAAPPLPVAATITNPIDKAVITSEPIIVSGTCPANSYVKLYRNAVFSGVGLCQADGSWHVQTDLFDGENSLQANDYNVTDQPGPVSGIITVTYSPPHTANSAPAVSETGSSTGTVGATKAATKTVTPVVLGSSFTYHGYNSGQLTDWPLVISGGTAPYAVSVDWGDGSSDLQSLQQAGQFDLQHTYKTIGSSIDDSYNIVVKATDADGQTTLLQFFTLITPQSRSPGLSFSCSSGVTGAQGMTNATSACLSPSPASVPSPYKTFIKVVAPTYAVCLVALASFWLGARHAAAMGGHHVALEFLRHLKRPR